MAINDVLPPKAARCDAITNLKISGAPRHQPPKVDGFIYNHDAAPLYSAGISTVYLIPFGEIWVPFADLRMRRLAMKQNAEFTDGG